MKKVKNGNIAKQKRTYGKYQYMTAKEQDTVVRNWETFVVARLNMDKSELRGTDYGSLFKPFTKALYHAWHMYTGHIAHNDRHGFFYAQFEQTARFRKNMRNMAAGIGSYGQPLCQPDGCGAYAGLRVMFEAMRDIAQHYLPAVELLYIEEQAAEEAVEIANAKDLLERHGMKVI